MTGSALQPLTQPVAKVPLASTPGRLLQRQCDCGTHAPGGGECEACRKKKLQRKGSGSGLSAHGLASVDSVLGQPGSPLDAEARAFLEPRFGQDFSGVRVHSNAQAADSAHSVGAIAYTVGRDIVFGQGRYVPRSRQGQALLAHELTHVVQQSGSHQPPPSSELDVDPSPAAEQEAQRVGESVLQDTQGPRPAVLGGGLQRLPLVLQRSFGTECSSKGVPCATGDACAAPDRGPNPGQGASTAWSLAVNIDTESGDWESALRSGDVGHAFVRFNENSGRQFTYGFYPASAVPNENVRTVPGCTHHPDNTHDSCTDARVNYTLSQPQYDAALAVAQAKCRTPGNYGVHYTCASFAREVALAAGQSIPSAASAPTTIFSQPVPSVDNPNTLKEGVEAEVQKDPKKRGFWNSASAPALRLQPVSPITLDGDPATPAFRLDWMPVQGATYRWRLYDNQDRHYLLRGAGADQPVLDFLDFTSNESAIVGRKTRDLLKSRGVTSGTVQCSVRFPVEGWADQIATLPVSFV